MASIQESAELNLVRPTFGRRALITGILFLVGVFWIAAMDSNDKSLITSDSVPATADTSVTVSTKLQSVDVPAYHFPDVADRADTYITPKETDCGRTASTPPHDYPSGWLRP